MKVEEIRKLSNEDIITKIVEIKKELFDLRLKQATGSLDKPSKINNLRKTVARMKTIMKERKIAEERGVVDGK